MAQRKTKPEVYESRLERATALIQYGFYDDSVLRSVGGMKLLMRDLHGALIRRLMRKRPGKGKALAKHYNDFLKEKRVNRKQPNPTLGHWIDYFDRESIFEVLNDEYGYSFQPNISGELNNARKLRNRVEYHNYSVSHAKALEQCELLALLMKLSQRLPSKLEEQVHANRVSTRSVAVHLGGGVLEKLVQEWRRVWTDDLTRWSGMSRASDMQFLISHLLDVLDLTFGIATDSRIDSKSQQQLVLALNYVISPNDLISEKEGNVEGLVDDAVVLIASLNWLISNSEDSASVFEDYWDRDNDAVKFLENCHAELLEKAPRIFEKPIWLRLKPILEHGPEALWTNESAVEQASLPNWHEYLPNLQSFTGIREG